MVVDRDAIASRVAELGAELSSDYEGRDPVLVCVLNGAALFAADLSRAVTVPHTLEFVALDGYGAGGEGREVSLVKDVDSPLAGRDVVIVEDVVDTGLTLNFLLRTIEQRGPREVAVCTLLDRPYRRLVDDLPIRYVGFAVPDEFFVGYGFALDGRYRGLPDLRLVARADDCAA